MFQIYAEFHIHTIFRVRVRARARVRVRVKGKRLNFKANPKFLTNTEFHIHTCNRPKLNLCFELGLGQELSF